MRSLALTQVFWLVTQVVGHAAQYLLLASEQHWLFCPATGGPGWRYLELAATGAMRCGEGHQYYLHLRSIQGLYAG